MDQFTRLLEDVAEGRESASAELFQIVYSELRSLAEAMFRSERQDHTLQPTALVHEAFLRLTGPEPVKPHSTAHFRAIAAQIMRRVLVDHARAHASLKRGGGRARIVLDDMAAPSVDAEPDIEFLDTTLRELAELDERAARIVELRFFGGLTAEEIAASMSVSLSTVERDWRFARAWLLDRMAGDEVS